MPVRIPVGLVAILAAGASLVPRGLAGQIPDSLPPDSLPPDTVDVTARFLEAQRLEAEGVPMFPLVGAEGPRPSGSRVVFDRDSIDWANAQTLGDLLAQIPGVFVWRGGWIGRPELPQYQGRGAASVEYLLDGVPLIPVGPDSVAVDPVLMSLSLLERVEVERWPGLLRVALYTRRHDRLAARSRLGVATGDDDVARYDGALQRQFASGLGFSLAADFLSAPTASGFASGHEQTQYWIQLGYLKSKSFGAQAQLLRTEPERDPFLGVTTTDTIGEPLQGNRSDYRVRVFTERGPPDSPLRIDLLYSRTSWDGSGVTQSFDRYGGAIVHRSRTAVLKASVFGGSRWTTLDVSAQAGWSPTSLVSLRAEARHQRHDGDRMSSWVGLRASLDLPRRITLAGSARVGSAVRHPAITADSAQDLRDIGVTATWNHRVLGAELGLWRTAAFAPRAFQPFRPVAAFAPVAETEWMTIAGRVSPAPWFTIDGWYSTALGGASSDGQPPDHLVGRATIRSKFLRKFPSGIFDLKLQLSAERWGAGVLGRDAVGAALAHPGATFLRGQVQLEFGRLRIFYDRYNLQGTDGAYVPGFPVPRFGTTFGVRWDFLN